MKTPKTFVAAALVAAAALFAGPAGATEQPYAKPDDSWISISGTVRDVHADRFTLDYGEGVITVEMDDGDRDADGYKLVAGDRVTVNGVVDADLYEKTTIEASSVYVEKLGTHFYASAADEEDLRVDDAFVTLTTPVVISRAVVQGTVTGVSGEEFTLDTGLRELTVEVDALGYDPLDDEGYQKIEVGDVVSVTGTMDLDFFEGRELVADSVIELRD